MPNVSVIIPTYNRANLLKETLESVFAQTYTDYEVLVIDDGSTDNTEEVVSALLADNSERQSKVRYIKQPNAGVSAARNHGIFEARGEWIAFLDSDDLWFPEKLEKQVAFLAEHPSAGAVCNPAYAYQDGQAVKDERGIILRHPWYTGPERATSILPFELFATFDYVWSSSVLVRKTVLYKAGLFEGGLKIGEDYILWVKVARFTEFWLSNEVLGFYRKHKTNATHDYDELRFYSCMVRKLQMVRWSNEPHIVKLYEQWLLSYYHYFLANVYRQKSEFKKVSNCWWLAMEYTHDWKLKSKIFVKFFIARFFPFVFRILDKRR